jgi:hypothetical protein
MKKAAVFLGALKYHGSLRLFLGHSTMLLVEKNIYINKLLFSKLLFSKK